MAFAHGYIDWNNMVTKLAKALSRAGAAGGQDEHPENVIALAVEEIITEFGNMTPQQIEMLRTLSKE